MVKLVDLSFWMARFVTACTRMHPRMEQHLLEGVDTVERFSVIKETLNKILAAVKAAETESGMEDGSDTSDEQEGDGLYEDDIEEHDAGSGQVQTDIADASS